MEDEIRRDFYVYIYFRLNGIPCYIGKGSGLRWRRHNWNSGNPHLKAIAKQARGKLPVIIIRDGLTADEAFAIEVAFIAAIGRADLGTGPLVNLTDGGDGTSNLTEETRRRIAVATAERMKDPDARANIARKNREIAADEEYKRFHGAAISAGMRANGPIVSPKRGIPISQAHKDLIGRKAAERMADPLQRQKISDGLTGLKQSEDTRKKRGVSLQAYWDARRNAGLSMRRPARDEQARRDKIRSTLTGHPRYKKV
jgi:hypothetical protein